MFKIDHSPAGKKLDNPNMSSDRLREIGLELNRLIDSQNQVLKGRAKLGDMAWQEAETYLQGSCRISLLFKELSEDWPDLHPWASRLVN